MTTVVRLKQRGGPPTTPEGYARWAHDVMVDLRDGLLVPEGISNLDAGTLSG
jgi:hypothetical protein